MLTIVTITVIAGLYSLIKAKDNLNRILQTLWSMTAMGVIAFMLVGLISFVPGLGTKDVLVEKTNVELVALNSSVSTQGTFFLIAGSIDQKFYYIYYWKDNTGGIHFDKIGMDQAVVHEVDNVIPRLVVSRVERTHEAPFNLLLLDMDTSDIALSVYNFYVPIGSVHKTFNMSLP